MKTIRLDSIFRRKLSDLLQGFVEHCEVSRHLTARIEVPIYFHGFKFGAPVFTHTGPSIPSGSRPIIGLVGLNGPDTGFPSDILLQLIEILAQRPQLAGDTILRILPVANPVALELQEDAPAISEWPTLQYLVDAFHHQAADGSIEIHPDKSELFTLDGTASPTLLFTLQEMEAGTSAYIPHPGDLQMVADDAKWKLRLNIPHSWSGAAKAHGIARFLCRLLESHAAQKRPRASGPRLS